MSKEERIKEVLEDMSKGNLIEVYNQYCDANSYYEDRFEYMDSFDDLFCGCSPTKIVESVDKDFSTSHDYFRDTIWGLQSWTEFDAYDEIVENELDVVVEYIIENGEDFGYSDLRDALNEDDEEEENQ